MGGTRAAPPTGGGGDLTAAAPLVARPPEIAVFLGAAAGLGGLRCWSAPRRALCTCGERVRAVGRPAGRRPMGGPQASGATPGTIRFVEGRACAGRGAHHPTAHQAASRPRPSLWSTSPGRPRHDRAGRGSAVFYSACRTAARRRQALARAHGSRRVTVALMPRAGAARDARQPRSLACCCVAVLPALPESLRRPHPPASAPQPRMPPAPREPTALGP